MRYEKRAFARCDVVLDGNEYSECTFDSCTFVYSGGALFTLTGNSIADDCRFAFTGPAGNAVLAMKAIYTIGDWGKTQIVATFEQIAPGITRH